MTLERPWSPHPSRRHRRTGPRRADRPSWRCLSRHLDLVGGVGGRWNREGDRHDPSRPRARGGGDACRCRSLQWEPRSHADDNRADDNRADDGHADDSHADDSHADDSHADDSHADDSHADDSHADDSHADDSHADDSHADDSHADDSHADDSHADDSHADDNHADDSHADDSHADDNRADDNRADDNRADDNRADDNRADDNRADDNRADDNRADDNRPTTTAPKPGEVVIERGLAYATWNDVTLTLDLYILADPKGAPVMVEPWEAFGEDIAQAGAIAVIEDQGIPDQPDSADGEPPFWDDHGALIRAHADAIGCKIRYARARAFELGSDEPIVVLGGFSAGGGLATHVALFGDTLEQRWDEFAATVGGPPRQVECVVAEGSTHVDALVVGNGTYDAFVPVVEGAFGRTYVLERAPELQPFLASAVGIDPSLRVRLMSASGDAVVPPSLAIEFAEVLADAGYDVQVIPYEGGHTSDPSDELSLQVFSELLGL